MKERTLPFFVLQATKAGVKACMGTRLYKVSNHNAVTKHVIHACHLPSQAVTPFLNALVEVLLAHEQQRSEGEGLEGILGSLSPETESPSQ